MSSLSVSGDFIVGEERSRSEEYFVILTINTDQIPHQ